MLISFKYYYKVDVEKASYKVALLDFAKNWNFVIAFIEVIRKVTIILGFDFATWADIMQIIIIKLNYQS